MKQREINISGIIDNNGKPRLYLAELNDFAKSWKNTRIVATFKIYNPGSSAALRGYYYNCVEDESKFYKNYLKEKKCRG